MRFERKYRLENELLAEVLQLIRLHPAAFQVLHPDRQINNIYFDTQDLMTFRQNLTGQNERRKFRVRWYGDDPFQIEEPQFEIKRKHNELGDKIVQPITPFALDELGPITTAVNEINVHFPQLRPVLLNTYRRSYFISADGRYRLTIDSQMGFHSLMFGKGFRQFLHHDPALIVELKYERQDDDKVGFITQYFPYRQARHSKYITGVLLTQ